MQKPTLLIVDDEKNTREGLRSALSDSYQITLARDGQEATDILREAPFDLLLTDLRMAGKSGLSVIDYALSLSPQPSCILMTAYGDVETAVEAMKRGAVDFLTKPLNLSKLEIVLNRAVEKHRLAQENSQLHNRLDQKYSLESLIGSSPIFLELLEKLKHVAPTKASILLQGETGTGKELAAQLIHQNSSRAKGPFISVHCAALPGTLLESELFGHEKGAFTGAYERRIGRFEAADTGTLFLDEIGEIDTSTQVKLLQFLETKTFERLGSTIPIRVDVRLVAATHRDLITRVNEHFFREDLYYRLSVVPVTLPALRERKTDIVLLINHYLQRFAKENNTAKPWLAPDAIQALESYPWPGNIRELRNMAENLVVLHHGKMITKAHLPLNVSPSLARLSFHKTIDLKAIEKTRIEQALAIAHGNRTAAAEILGISRRTLHRKIAEWSKA